MKKQFSEMTTDEKWAWLNSKEYFERRDKKHRKEFIIGIIWLIFSYGLIALGLAIILNSLK